MTASALRRVRVAEVERIADEVQRFRLVDASGAHLPVFSAGSHVVVTMHGANGHVWKNPYSLISAPDDGRGYEISVLRLASSRGGSAFMHAGVQPGTELHISEPVNLFPIARQGRKHILVAGGIGITPFLAMMQDLAALNANFCEAPVVRPSAIDCSPNTVHACTSTDRISVRHFRWKAS